MTVAPHSPVVTVADAAEPPLALNRPASFKDQETWGFYARALERSGTVVAIPQGRYALPIDYNFEMPEVYNGNASLGTFSKDWKLWDKASQPLKETFGPRTAYGVLGAPKWGSIEPARKNAARKFLAMYLDDYVNEDFSAANRKLVALQILLGSGDNGKKKLVDWAFPGRTGRDEFQQWTGYSLSTQDEAGRDVVNFQHVKDVEVPAGAPEFEVVVPQGFKKKGHAQNTPARVLVIDLESALKKATEGPSIKDDDHDGLTNEEEEKLGTDPTNPDTDGDGFKDGDEVSGAKNPFKDNKFDPNGKPGNTNPLNPDTDGDSISDGQELNPAAGGKQTDPNSFNTNPGGIGKDTPVPNDNGSAEGSSAGKCFQLATNSWTNPLLWGLPLAALGALTQVEIPALPASVQDELRRLNPFGDNAFRQPQWMEDGNRWLASIGAQINIPGILALLGAAAFIAVTGAYYASKCTTGVGWDFSAVSEDENANLSSEDKMIPVKGSSVEPAEDEAVEETN